MNYELLFGKIKSENLTSAQVAKSIGLTPSHFSRKMNGEYAFKQSEIVQLCEVLKISENDIPIYFFAK